MTTHDMYDALLHAYRYKNYDCYPATRYESCHDREYEWWKPVREDYAKIFKENDMNFNNTKILVDGREFKAYNIDVTSNCDGTVITASAHLTPFMNTASSSNKTSKPSKSLSITNVIFNPPATIVFWSDKTKTIVKADYDYEFYDPEKGIAMAIAKKMMGDNKGSYYNLFKHWRKKWDKQNETKVDVEIPKTPLDTLANNLKKVFINPVIEGVCANGEEED